MASPDPTFSLNNIGEELDRARMSRNGDGRGRRMSELEAVSETSEISPVRRPAVLEAIEQGGPVCVCCLTRPPSAVLLPCCHLNLCYLCAPLLILKGQRPPPPLDTAFSAISTSPSRPSYYEALKQATANHPKSRRLSMGHCDPPDRGTRGSEMTGKDLLDIMKSQPCTTAESQNESEEGWVDRSGLKATGGDDARVDLSCKDDERGARCLVCRSTVTGWLRVYSG